MTPRKTAPAKVAAPATATTPAQQLTVRRKMPELSAFYYDGTNAVPTAQWLAGQGTQAQIVFPTAPNALPYLVDPVSGQQLATQVYVLPSLETVDLTDLSANYDVIA